MTGVSSINILSNRITEANKKFNCSHVASPSSPVECAPLGRVAWPRSSRAPAAMGNTKQSACTH